MSGTVRVFVFVFVFAPQSNENSNVRSSSRLPISRGMVPVIWLLCTEKKSKSRSWPIWVPIDPCNRLSFKSSCLRFCKVKIEVGISPPIKLKSRSRISKERVPSKMSGMSPVMAPFCRRRILKEVSWRSSEFSVPVNPFESKKKGTRECTSWRHNWVSSEVVIEVDRKFDQGITYQYWSPPPHHFRHTW